MIKNYRMVLEYDGSRYDGWQKQGNTEQTIQGKIEQVLERMTGQAVEVHGSGRTDAGVHALAQVANFHMDGKMASKEIQEYLNQYLPEDIRVITLEPAKERFHSRLNAQEKTYLYRIEMGERKQVFERKYIYGLYKSLNVEAMERASAYLTGEHDFKSFCSNRKMKKSTVRVLKEIEFEQQGSRLLIRYTGNGFLYNMVRIITGTLIEVGLGQRKAEDMKGILEAKDRNQAGFTAPPEGLFLEQVRYNV
ncbi:tRNA pseudouridine(38-40) synthase TruA [Lacrimispora saccharolytica]|uniref:tRNA pseudouridine synthase A n=1 Tax=Lacrimispora saccharolytica (strain ATCC 35040 / DSM 2544 / NRCC 2533 / WM1) TaxID=610130 RepID=D9R5X6_LACSW|nr:tRNA pseudouridine(38-40) synthase TruA [Lacrimispora saccharolytica]ADL03410.1 tRNA pseudouridine synthase A [[Clostridium] saccharolyticum WM1]QRV18440.1 tRNA pseudouridine(38-40) synthase TruA [Lacrimispora saccharolytica]